MTLGQYLLCCLGEEAAEIAYHAAKSQRFGLEDHEPECPQTNRERLHVEINELLAVAELIGNMGGRIYERDENVIAAKRERLRKYVEYSVSAGTLDQSAIEQFQKA
jgi:hypothetical protein